MAADIKQMAKVVHSTGKVSVPTCEALGELKRLTAAVEAIAEGAGYDLVREP